jgi:hypothetical protein
MNGPAQPPKPPADLKRSGRVLWAALVDRLDFDAHELRLLHEACRASDRCDAMARALGRQGVVVRGGGPNGLLRESREQAITLARLITAMRLPDDLSEPAGRRSQRRGTRGVHALRAVE